MKNLIAIDWGTTSFRASLFTADGTITDTVQSSAGIMQEKDGEFEDVLYAHVGGWLEEHPHCTMIASGMITSRQGWVETPYLPCPAHLEDLSKNLTEQRTARGDTVFFVPGVCQNLPTPNIMRGEETQMAGLNGGGATTAVLPGTHSKWIRMEGGTIRHFSTFMTGELFAALINHTILGRLLTDGSDPAGFEAGVRDGFADSGEAGGILSKLFGARAMPLLGSMHADSIRDYISGLLLGTEIQEAIDIGYGHDGAPVICGSAELAERYQTALKICSIRSEPAQDDLASRGLMRIAAAARLV